MRRGTRRRRPSTSRRPPHARPRVARVAARPPRRRAPTRDAAVARLHALLLRAARFEVARRRPTLPHLRGDELDDIAIEAADDALMSVLAAPRRLPRRQPLHDLGLQVRPARGRGEAAQARLAGPRGAARARGAGALFASAGLEPDARGRADASCSTTLQPAIDEVLTPHQRRVLVALALNGVPIDVLAERLEHDPRRALQDPARRAAEAARPPRRARARARRLAGGDD